MCSVQADSLKAHLASVLGNQALDDDVVDEALTRPSSVAEYQAKRTDPDADHKPRYRLHPPKFGLQDDGN